MSAPGPDLVEALSALDRRARAFSVAAWRAKGRSVTAFALAAELVTLAREAGDDVPAGTPRPEVEAHAIADLLAVLGADLVAAAPSADLRARAAAAVESATAQLEATVRLPGR